MAGADEAAARAEADLADPDLVARLGVVSARPGVRVWAFAIDIMIWLLLAAPAVLGAMLMAGGDVSWGPLVLLIAGAAAPTLFAVIQLVLHGRRGVTAGKAAMRLRSVSVHDLGRPGFWRIVLRALVLGASFIVPLVGPLILLSSSLWDRAGRGRSILDRIAGCWLIDVRAGLDPLNARALRRAVRELEMPLREVAEDLPSLASAASGSERLVLAGRRSRAAIVGLPGGPWSEPPPPAPDGLIAEVPHDSYHLVFEDGSTVLVPAFGLLGRAPEAPAGRAVDALITLEDPQKLLSKTHLAFGADPRGVWIADQGSSNGTVVVGVDGTETALVAGAQVGLVPGSVVRAGGRMFQIRQGSPTG
ncbi:RDD family protein [Microbacterium sp. NPDC091313]